MFLSLFVWGLYALFAVLCKPEMRDAIRAMNDQLGEVSVGQDAIRRLNAINDTVNRLRPEVDALEDVNTFFSFRKVGIETIRRFKNMLVIIFPITATPSSASEFI